MKQSSRTHQTLLYKKIQQTLQPCLRSSYSVHGCCCSARDPLLCPRRRCCAHGRGCCARDAAALPVTPLLCRRCSSKTLDRCPRSPRTILQRRRVVKTRTCLCPRTQVRSCVGLIVPSVFRKIRIYKVK